MASLDIANVKKAYGDVEVIRDVSIGVPDGAFVVLVGPSGCGKSTLLRMIAGLEDISGGTISIGGKVINEVEPKNRDIAMVFQNYALYPHMTIAENMGFSLRLAGRPKPEIAQRVEDAARILGLSDYLGRYPKQLSGGQRQRVAMGRAIVRNPQVFLFDEPLSNLDAKLRVQMRAELKELHARLKTTMIYVTHDQIEAMTMADFIVVMRDGVVEQMGAPLALYDTPSNLFVAGFIGSPAMNQLPGRLVADENGSRFVGAGDIAWPLETSIRTDRPVTLGIRPEHLVPAPDGQGVPARIKLIEQTGSETYVIAHFGETPIVALFRQRLPLAIGDTISLTLAPGAAHLFDTETGQRLTA
ncbi:sn-glycerol-3-phosphate ABC transporter ATP-binding protein UgpC [Arsenicitalea aurantiaca]|uniref:sn-glycerol-3-phosphate ABC transporter ATP-binding protein UgpC n=1 Tax=Arsenicitalea aurantiaca TaxID=1783274 RepID=A0A433XK62_9HYPH|nr:sn-glycerol-3-phosphate ABC transporter ATP-binding protein UgpC [Arsenicitalea aurantiaca]RUT34472.1 sn-glycerol-3-phosphate ABC transporter ATP-binding protein UgpC [Arsenicitalea aurantiaca]